MTIWGLHIHHRVSFEPLVEPVQNRIDYIQAYKPGAEVATRLRVLKILTDEEAARLPAPLVMAGAALDKAQAARNKARAALNKAWAARNKALTARDEAWATLGEAQAALNKAQAALDKAGAACKPELVALHKELCVADCPWNGETLFPTQKEV